MFSFEVTDAEGTARRGVLDTPHGLVETPAFMPVGTAGSVKGVTPSQLRGTGTEMILANTYHLQLRPTSDVVRDLGGLHGFMGWDGPILTDSGGYQVFSLGGINRITDDGVEFRSHVDGSPMRLDPAIATKVQNDLGADVIMTFDQCPPLPADTDTVRTAVNRTIRWARICKDVHGREDQALFGILQGGLDLRERERCAKELLSVGFDGYAIGGLSVGESREQMLDVVEPVGSLLPADQPRYLMGVGTPRDILAAVRAGIDLFDCVLPTRNGRNSHAFTARGILRMRNEKHRLDPEPFEPDCDCEACRGFSRGYVRHLFNAGEMLGPTLTSIHNLRFYQRFMARIRDLIHTRQLARMMDEFPIVSAEASETEDA
jgi:queuine tRNA-ribosyltransferase